MITEDSPTPAADENGGSPESRSSERKSRSPTKEESRKNSRSSSSGSSSASEESAGSGESSSESASESDSSVSPDRQKSSKKKKRRHSSSCVDDTGKTDEEPAIIDIKDVPADVEKVGSDNKEDGTECVKKERHRHRRSQSRSRPRRSRKDHRRRSRDRRRSRSRGGKRSSRSRERRRRERSRKEGHRRRRSRSGGRRRSASRDRRREGRRRRHRRGGRSRSRSPRRRSTSRPRSRSPVVSKKRRNEPLSFKEKLKQSFLEVQKQAAEGRLNIDDLDPDKKGLLSMNEKPSALPLNSDKPLTAMAMGSGTVTPQQALLQTMAAMHQKAQELTGVAVPKYYNPAAVNPLKYAEQVQKRKLLWAKKEPKNQEVPQPMSSEWKAVAYAQDGDTKSAEKFRKLMGIKNQGGAAEESKPGPSATVSEGGDKDRHTNDMVKKQEELFRNLDKEYEFARMTTHTHRGVGLGFTSHVPYFPK